MWVGGEVSLVYMHSAICESYLVWWYSMDLLSIGVGECMYAQYMYILLHVKLMSVMVFYRSIVNWSGGCRCVVSICVFCYMWNLFGGMVVHRSIVNWSWGGRCMLSICAFCYMWNLFGGMVFHTSIVNWCVEGGTCILSICAFCHMWNLFDV